MTRRNRRTISRVVIFLMAVAVRPSFAADFAFQHPGLLIGSDDLARIRGAVASKQEPIYSGYQRLLQDPESQLSYRMQGPLPAVGRNGGAGHSNTYDNDAAAAYHFALIWAITGDHSYAQRSIEIVDAWSSTLKTIDGRDAVLMAGLAPFQMINAAEILRSTQSGWTDAQAAQTEKCFKEVVYPVLQNFALYANGNWDTAAVKTVMAIGVFCNDRTIFENGIHYYTHGAGNGSLFHYIINDQGQCQESGRDAAHWQLGIGHLGDCCEIAWHQGLDLYGYGDNRLLHAFEYAAKYNLGGSVSFEPMIDRTGKYPWAAITKPGPLRPIYEEIYNHYVVAMRLDSPTLEQAIHSARPEGPSRPVGDHPGFGTLLFARTKPSSADQSDSAAPASPAALAADGEPHEITLTWVSSRAADFYTVKRAATHDGPYLPVARDLKTAAWTDKSVHAGELFYYVVTASNTHGESPASAETAIPAGLPKPWQAQDIGAVKQKGWSNFDGKTFVLDASGRAFGGTADAFHYVCTPIRGDETITARFQPPMSSLRAECGLMMRESVAPDSPHVALLITPGSDNPESPGYAAVLLDRPTPGAATSVVGRCLIPAPCVSDGRLLQPLWLRLTRTGHQFTAFVSIDGNAWSAVPSLADASPAAVDLPLKENLLAGLPVCSGILQKVVGQELAVDAVVTMDHVTLNPDTPPSP